MEDKRLLSYVFALLVLVGVVGLLIVSWVGYYSGWYVWSSTLEQWQNSKSFFEDGWTTIAVLFIGYPSALIILVFGLLAKIRIFYVPIFIAAIIYSTAWSWVFRINFSFDWVPGHVFSLVFNTLFSFGPPLICIIAGGILLVYNLKRLETAQSN